ncbi:MAG: single-stranded DNA-binding protein [Betaproteobacteria bacterium]|nr:single-stranded DNA-binding protein [Betaproteobacteria bacterium]
MQSNMFIGNLAKAPVLAGNAERAVCKFVLISNEYAGKDEQGQAKERQVSLQFTAFRGKAEAIAKHTFKGDQLIVDYRIENNHYQKEGEDIYDYNFIVEDFSFGAPGKEKQAARAA